MVLCLLTRIFSPFFPFLSYSLLESWSKRRGAAGPGRMDGRRTFGRRVVNVTARATNSLLLSLSPPAIHPLTKQQHTKSKTQRKIRLLRLRLGGKNIRTVYYYLYTHTHTHHHGHKNFKGPEIEGGRNNIKLLVLFGR